MLLRSCILNYEQDHYFGSMVCNTPGTNINHELTIMNEALNYKLLVPPGQIFLSIPRNLDLDHVACWSATVVASQHGVPHAVIGSKTHKALAMREPGPPTGPTLALTLAEGVYIFKMVVFSQLEVFYKSVECWIHLPHLWNDLVILPSILLT